MGSSGGKFTMKKRAYSKEDRKIKATHECPICFEECSDVETLPHAGSSNLTRSMSGRDVSEHKACGKCRASMLKENQKCPWCRDEVVWKQVLDFLDERGIEFIDELRSGDVGSSAADTLEDGKLRTRFLQGIESLSNPQALRLPQDANLTADERTLERLKGQARQLTPAVHRMRGAAVDAGCY